MAGWERFFPPPWRFFALGGSKENNKEKKRKKSHHIPRDYVRVPPGVRIHAEAVRRGAGVSHRDIDRVKPTERHKENRTGRNTL